MQTSTEKNGTGGFPAKVARPIIIAPIENKTLSAHPSLCMRCTDEYTIQPDGPDAGKLFACGIMVKNIEAGCMSFYCPYFKPSIAPIIDSDTANAALSLRAAAESIEPCFNPQRWLAERGL